MKIITKIFLFFIFTTTLLFGGNIDDIQIEYPKQTKECKIVYPTISNSNMLNFRLKKVDLAKGLFEYYMYSGIEIVKNDIFWMSDSCKKKYNSLTVAEQKKLDNELKSIDFADEEKVEKEVGNSIEALEKKYLGKNYGDTTTTQFLNTSKYLIAVLTLNHEIIDIQSSIMMNEIILKQGYSIGDNKLTKKLNLNFFTFIFEWVTKSDIIFKQLQMALLGFFLPVSIALLSLSKVSRKVQGLYEQEDLLERGMIGVIIFLLFVMAPNRFEDKQKDIAYAQSHFQSQIGTISRIGVEYADKLSNTLTSSYVNKLKKDVGVSSKDEVKRVLEHTLKLEKELSGYKSLQNQCYSNLSGKTGGDGFQPDAVTSFPTSEHYQRGAGGLAWDETQYFKKWNDDTTDIKYTLTFCRNVDILTNTTKRAIARNEEFINRVKQSSGTQSINDFAKTAQQMMKSSAEYGFLYAPFIMFNKVFIENYGLMKPLNATNEIEKGNDEAWGINKLMYTAPLMSAPGVESTLKVYKELSVSQGMKKVAGKFLDGIPFIGDGIKGGIDYALDKAGYALIIGMMSKVYEYLPLLGITISSILVISYFGITLFVYGLISPFYAVYVFSTQQKDSIVSFLVRGIVIMFKPILIVISIVIAILAVELMTNLGYTISNEVFTFFTTNNIAFNLSLSSMIISFLHGLVDLAIAIITTLFAFYFVFKGSDLILSVFGYRDGGIDSHEVVNEIEQKVSHKATGV